MANWAVVEDGKIVESTSQSSLKKARTEWIRMRSCSFW